MKIPFPFWNNASPKRKRIYSIVFMLALAIATTLIGTLVPLSAQDAKQINDSLNQTVTTNRANGTLIPSIFINNFGLCLAMFIPLAGAVFGLFIMFNTGIALGAELRVQSTSASTAAASSISPTTAIIALFFIGLTFLLEYVSYSIGISESVWLFRRLMQRRWGELKTTGILVGIVAILLITGAVVETWVITAVG
jgi:hypothetical protein